MGVDFDGAASTDSDGLITEYLWSFGDGSAASTGVQVSHTFTAPGNYSVRLTVTDDDGDTATRTSNIRSRGATLTGTVQILSTSAVDSDVNDRLTTPVANNDFITAQPLVSPVQLGGFVNLPDTGSSTGNFFTTGDPGDFFAISLAGGEIILLNIADADADLDLRLWDSARNLVDFSIGSQATESLVVPAAGAYFIEVFPASDITNIAGASNYVLSVGQDLSVTGRSPSRLSDTFVAGELLVGATLSDTIPHQSYDLTPRGRAGPFFRAALGRRTGELIRQRFGIGAVDAREMPSMTADQRQKYRTLLAAKQLPRDPRIASAEPNLLLQPSLEPDDPLYPLQWHLPAISLPAAWDLTTGSPTGPEDVIVAVIDTGILPGHPDFASQLVPGYDFVEDATRAGDGGGIDNDPTDPGDLAYGRSSSFHGTHVAGTVAARSDNDEGVAGVSWGAKLMPVRALGIGGGTTFDVIESIRWAAGLSTDSNTTPPPQPADIINMSLGSPFFSSAAQATITEARGAGVIVIAAAGNESTSDPFYPAAYTGVVSVSATTIDGSLAPYSNFGAVDVAAPGGYNATDLNGDGFADGVVSTRGDDSNPGPVQLGYGALNGTSMAAPHVAGVAALMKALHPGLTPDEFDNALLSGDLTDDFGVPGPDQFYGNGLINAQKAALAALSLAGGGGSDPGPVLGSSLNAVNFGVLASTQNIVLSNIGTGTIQVVDPPVSSEGWLTISAINIDANRLGEYQLQIDRAGLAEGAYNATATFEPVDPGTNSVTVSVTMQVAGSNPDANAGLFYVILVSEDGNTVGSAAVVNPTSGEYPFTLTDVPTGNYRLFAGSDMDDDNFLCDTGEACGGYRTLGAPETVTVDPATTQEIGNLDFVSEYRAVLTTQGTSALAPASSPDPSGFSIGKQTP